MLYDSRTVTCFVDKNHCFEYYLNFLFFTFMTGIDFARNFSIIFSLSFFRLFTSE